MASTLTRTRPEQAGLREMLNQLDTLMVSVGDDGEFHAPTGGAASKMREFLEGVTAFVKAVPLGTLSADGEGGVRLEWIRPERELRLVISASPQGRSYIYHEQGDDYAADYAPTISGLGKWLSWLGD